MKKDASKQKDLSRSTSMMGITCSWLINITGFKSPGLRHLLWAQPFLQAAYSIACRPARLVGAGMLTTTFLPVHTSLLRRRVGQDEANAYTSNLLSIVVVTNRSCCRFRFLLCRKWCIHSPSRQVLIWSNWQCTSLGSLSSVMLWPSPPFSLVFWMQAETTSGQPRPLSLITLWLQHRSLRILSWLTLILSWVYLFLCTGKSSGRWFRFWFRSPHLNIGIKLSWRINLKTPRLKGRLRLARLLWLLWLPFVTMSVRTSSRSTFCIWRFHCDIRSSLIYMPYSIWRYLCHSLLRAIDSWAKRIWISSEGL